MGNRRHIWFQPKKCFWLKSHSWIQFHSMYMSAEHLQAHWQRWRCRAPWCCSHCKGWNQPVERLMDYKDKIRSNQDSNLDGWERLENEQKYQRTKNPSPRMQERATEFQAAAVNFSTKHLFLGERTFPVIIHVNNQHCISQSFPLNGKFNLTEVHSPESGRSISCSHCSDEHREVG